MMKRSLLVVLAALAVLCGTLVPHTAWAAQPMQPVAVASLAGYDRLYANIDKVGRLADNPFLAQGLEAMLKLVTRGRGLDGVDRARPWGVVILSDGEQTAGLAFIPLTDLDALYEVAEPILGPAEVVEAGVWRMTGAPEPLFVAEKGDWLFLSDRAERLAHAPAEPGALVGDLAERFDLAVQVLVGQIPAAERQRALERLRRDAERELRRRDDESELEHALRRRVVRGLVDAAEHAAHELDRIVAGWVLDTETGRTHMDVEVTALEGTATARELGRLAGLTTRRAGFGLEDAAVTGSVVGRLTDPDIRTLTLLVDAAMERAHEEIARQPRSEEEKQVAGELLDQLAGIVRSTIEMARIDTAVTLLLDPDATTLLAAKTVADGHAVESLAGRIAEIVVREHPVVEDWITEEAGAIGSIRFHTIAIPIPYDIENRREVVRMFGEQLVLVLGVDEEDVYLGAGRDALARLIEAVAASEAESETAAVPVEISLALRPLFGFLAEMGEEEDRPQAARLAAALEVAGDQDHVHLVVSSIDHGLRVRVEVEEGLVRALGRAVGRGL